MAKRKSKPQKKPNYSKIKDPERPLWMQVLRLVTIVLLAFFAIGVFATMLIMYYRIVFK